MPGDLPDEWLRRMRDGMVELLSLRTAPQLFDTLGDLAGGVRAARGSSGSAEEYGRRLVEQSLRRADGAGREPSGSNGMSASPFGSRRTADSSGPPEAQRRYPVDDYIVMWERRHGREMTADERKVLGQGCIGVTKIRLGLMKLDAGPPTNLAFADPDSHRAIQSVENILAPGEIANARVNGWRKRLGRAESLVAEHGTDWPYKSREGAVITGPEYIGNIKKNLDIARAQAREIWSNIAKGDLGDVRESRREARIESNQRAFGRVSNYVQRFEAILATGPADVGDFMRLVKADPELSRLRDIDQHLPSGNPTEWKTEIFSKQFWSGQEIVRDRKGNPVVKAGVTGVRATQTPDPTLFEPNPATGQVDMSGDYNCGKPGYGNFDYALYDEPTGSWWNANHGDWRIYPEFGNPSTAPMEVHQNTPEKFFAGRPDFDSAVICIAFTKVVQ
ncbi:hypothetical protein GCM10011588_04930 [Nocardia jinanensis]|uniref:Uncharacterized protein n=2 Tax=Nocardia jinanensis TaxID=382504 RepID=A0A917VK92_9NOCA|nr:hypothetical protein GCM10011588_04930 [Nocardia jinanensis]